MGAVYEVGPNDRLIIAGIEIDPELIMSIETDLSNTVLFIGDDHDLDIFIVRNGRPTQEERNAL